MLAFWPSLQDQEPGTSSEGFTRLEDPDCDEEWTSQLLLIKPLPLWTYGLMYEKEGSWGGTIDDLSEITR